MKVLTIKQPHASAIMDGKKPIEYRSWKPSELWFSVNNSKFVVHAGMTMDKRQQLTPILKDFEYPHGALLGIVQITDIRMWHGDTAKGIFALARLEYKTPIIYGWQLEVVEVFAEPIPAKGRLGFWEYLDIK